MKRLILFLVFISNFGFSQNKHDDGPYKNSYKTGELKTQGFYKNDKKRGAWKEYYKTGQLRKVYSFDGHGKRTGAEAYYSESGKLVNEKIPTINRGLVAKSYFDDGKLHIIYNLSQNKRKQYEKTGSYKEYYQSGVLKIESEYVNNELSGLWKQYFDTGEVEWEVEYFKGYKQGSYKQFYKSGQLKLEGNNLSDVLQGEERRYNENLVLKGSYHENAFKETWEHYNSTGVLVNKLVYKKGKLKKGNSGVVINKTIIPDGVIERVPVFPGCEIFPSNKARRTCLSKSIQKFINSKFKIVGIIDAGVYGKASVNTSFKIDKTGKVIDIKAKSKHKVLEEEAINLISKLPKMIPGYVKGKAVIVPYSFPIILQVTQ